MKYQVITRCGGYFWPGWSAVIGEYRWLWVAKCRAWWHVRIENPRREVTVISKSNAPAMASADTQTPKENGQP